MSGLFTLPGLLMLLFIALKLCGKIAWPWLWVLSPVWIPAAGLFIVLGLFMVMFGAGGPHD